MKHTTSTTSRPPIHRNSTKTKPKNQLEPKSWLPISNQKWSAHQTLEPNQQGTPRPRYIREHHIKSNRIATSHRLPVSKQKWPAHRKPTHNKQDKRHDKRWCKR